MGRSNFESELAREEAARDRSRAERDRRLSAHEHVALRSALRRSRDLRAILKRSR